MFHIRVRREGYVFDAREGSRVVTKEWMSGAAPLLLFNFFLLMWYKKCYKSSTFL